MKYLIILISVIPAFLLYFYIKEYIETYIKMNKRGLSIPYLAKNILNKTTYRIILFSITFLILLLII